MADHCNILYWNWACNAADHVFGVGKKFLGKFDIFVELHDYLSKVS